MELGVDVVGTVPADMDGRIGPDHMVVGQQMAVAQLLDALAVRAYGRLVGTELGLGEHYTDLHLRSSSHALGPATAAVSVSTVPGRVGSEESAIRVAPGPGPRRRRSPLLPQGGHALAVVGAGHHGVEQGLGRPHRLGRGQVERLVDLALGGSQRGRGHRGGQHGGRTRPTWSSQLVTGDHRGDQAQVEGLVGVEGPAGQDQVEGPGQPDELGAAARPGRRRTAARARRGRW